MRLAIAIFLALTLAGCAKSSGVVPVGEDTYLISRSEKGTNVTGSEVKADAIKEANEYCQSEDKSLKLLDSTAKDMVPFKSDAQAEIRFQCK